MNARPSEAQVRTQMATATGLDDTVWHELAAMGLTGLLIDEEHGGAGAGPVEMGIAMEENTEDGALGLHLGQCNGTCEYAPQIWLDGVVRGPLTSAETVRLARQLKEQA